VFRPDMVVTKGPSTSKAAKVPALKERQSPRELVLLVSVTEDVTGEFNSGDLG
jgi:hypothetical protein